MEVPLLDLKAQFESIRDEVLPVLEEIAVSQQYILGPWVSAFEKDCADYLGIEHAIGVSSGTDALLLALMAHDIGPGDAVLTTPYSFFSTAGSIVRTGATPVFVDIDPVTYQIDAADLTGRLEEPAPGGTRFRAVMPVHLYGACADMPAIHAIARAHGLLVIEDTAQAFGAASTHPAETGGFASAGTIGDAGCFSFYPSKNLGAFGDAGLVVCRDAARAEKMRALRNHGMEPKYHHGMIGGNFRLDGLQAGVLSVKLRHLAAWSQARRERAQRYRTVFAEAGLDGSPVTLPQEPPAIAGKHPAHIYHQFVIRAPRRDELAGHLRAHGIGCEIYYPIPLHRQECFVYLGYAEGTLPHAERAARETLALPVYPELSDAQQDHVVAAIRAFYA